MKTVRWGLLACGRIAKVFATGLLDSESGKLGAVASRDGAKAREFVEQLPAGLGEVRAYGSYEELLSDPEIDAVYISTPHSVHAKWTVLAAEAGKHVLCEKPAALNAWEAEQAIEACRENNVLFCEAFMYRFAPHVDKIREIIQSGELGEIRHIQADFGFMGPENPASRLINAELGGGGILDVGCYAMSAARFIAGAAVNQAFLDPEVIRATGELHPDEGTDLWSTASLRFAGGITAQLTTAVRAAIGQRIVIYGTGGRLECDQPFLTAKEGGIIELRLYPGNREPKILRVESRKHLYAYEADAVASHLADAGCPQMLPDDTLGNLRAMDVWRAEIGVVYPGEDADQPAPPLRGSGLARRAGVKCPTGNMPGVSFPVSRLVLGIDNQRSFPHMAGICDDFVERGGNAFDTGFVYGRGLFEELLGRWMESRAIRYQVAVVVKGAHTPNCDPASLSEQLAISLDRLRSDYADLYLMHRDNPEVPVGEFVDVLNEHFRAGRIRAFGGSNWTVERLEEANAYAAAHGLEPMRAISNNFSLARMMDPVWPGCIAASEPAFKEWLERSHMTLLSWSSQARGFFVRADPGDRTDEEMVRCWYGPENFERLKRARQLADRKGCSPLNIALAYVLAQPFPTFCLVGPRTIAETRTSWPGLFVDLSPEEVDWLDLR